MKVLYKINYWHRNWGWDCYKADLTKGQLPYYLDKVKRELFVDAYGDQFLTEKIRLYKYVKVELIEEVNLCPS